MVLDTLNTAKNINIASGLEVNNGLASSFDKHDYYGFDINGSTNIYLSLKALSSDIDLNLLDSNGNTIASSVRGGSSAEDISRILGTGRYYIDVNQYNGSSSYQLITSTNQLFAAVNNDVSLLLGDFNGDGYRDVVRQEKGALVNGSNDVQVIMGQSNGGFQSPFQITDMGITNGNIANLVTGDFNGDGRADLIRQEFGQNVNGVNDAQFMEFQNGNFQVTRNMPDMGAMNGNLTNLIAGDFNGDGRADLIRQERGGWVNGDRDVEIYIFDANWGIQQRLLMNEASINTDNDVELIAGNFITGGGTDLMRIEKSQNINGVNDILFYDFQNGNFQRSAPNFNPPPTSTFNSTFGYGLVNAATAVARSINQSTFSDVANLGGTNWSNDLVNAPEVWARGYTGQGITVAVIDSGVDINHEDLRGNIWSNVREIAGNGIDDDRNGYIDDINGWNFGVGQNNNNISPGTSSNGHGTHVAGTIAARNNGIGVNGVAYNSRIMSIRMGDVNNQGYFTNAGNLSLAIRYAVDNGARVINMSLGWSDSTELSTALAYAASRNVITVSAAGNGALAAPGNPAKYATDYGISVGAVDSNRFLASFSNRAGTDSRMQHLVAPGVNIRSTLPNNAYAEWGGTSMAAPHVAGVAALMLSANPNLTAEQIRSILTSTANQAGLGASAAINNSVISVSSAPRIADHENFFSSANKAFTKNSKLDFFNKHLLNKNTLPASAISISSDHLGDPEEFQNMSSTIKEREINENDVENTGILSTVERNLFISRLRPNLMNKVFS
jgi:trimeric autotransporter adhesin